MLQHSTLIIRDNVLFDVPSLEQRFWELVCNREEEIARELGGNQWQKKLDSWRERFLPEAKRARGEMQNWGETGMPRDYFLALQTYMQTQAWAEWSIQDLYEATDNLFKGRDDAQEMGRYHASMAWKNLPQDVMAILAPEALDMLGKWANCASCYHYSSLDGREKRLFVLTERDHWPVDVILREIEEDRGGTSLLSTGLVAEEAGPDMPPLKLIKHIRDYCGDYERKIRPSNVLYVARGAAEPAWREAGIRQVVFQPEEPLDPKESTKTDKTRETVFAAQNYDELTSMLTEDTWEPSVTRGTCTESIRSFRLNS